MMDEVDPMVRRRQSVPRFHLIKRAAAIRAADNGDNDELLTTKQLARLMGVSEIWLIKRRQDGTGPPYEMLSARCLRYRRSGYRGWLEEIERMSTAEYSTRVLYDSRGAAKDRWWKIRERRKKSEDRPLRFPRTNVRERSSLS
jgi:predicted DNA-binding transcriptional regulator AlpA